MINRIVSKAIQKSQHSILLIGPRQTGKSTLIQSLKPEMTLNLADESTLFLHTSRPEELKVLIDANQPQTVFIDEIQKNPKMMNTIQFIVDDYKLKNRKIKFYLTGSSARKIRRQGGNLLPGRVLNFNLGPFVAKELNYEVNTVRALELGMLPQPYLEKDERVAQKLLASYSANYLKEEIREESMIRNLDSFSRFLADAIQFSGSFLDYTKMAKRTKISRHSIPRYFEVLEETLVGQRLESFPDPDDEFDLIKHLKFYFFDGGVLNGLQENFKASQDRIGRLSEHLILNQIIHSCWAADRSCKVYTYRKRNGLEVDFIFEIDGVRVGIEVKSSANVHSEDFESLKIAKAEIGLSDGFIFHTGPTQAMERKFAGFWSMPWQLGLKRLGL